MINETVKFGPLGSEHLGNVVLGPAPVSTLPTASEEVPALIAIPSVPSPEIPHNITVGVEVAPFVTPTVAIAVRISVAQNEQTLPPNDGSQPNALTPSGGLLYFSATSFYCERKLWAYSPAERQTFLVYEFGLDTRPGPIRGLYAHDGELYFGARATNAKTAHDIAFWRSDGTPEGTIQLSETVLWRAGATRTPRISNASRETCA